MHKEIFNPNQMELLSLVKQFKKEFYLVGGTAIALHIGHRRSIDFDLFKSAAIRHRSINILRLPDLLDLAAMKAYALGRRSKWKDYIDIYFF